jgi:predicted flap endonuclease-1-like 5' DNA nuclease
MDPTLVVIGFVVLLAALLYYMYKDQRKRPPEEPGARRDKPTVVKAREYEAQVEADKKTEKPKPEPKPELRPESKHEPEPKPTPEAKPEPAESLESLSGIGEKYRTLLKAAGVETLPALAAWGAEDLFKRLMEVNESQQIVKRPPPLATVEDWVKRAGGQTG